MAAWAEGAAAVDAGWSWRQVPLGAPHTAESPVRQSVQLPGPGGQLEDEKDREWERYSGHYLLNMPTTMSPRSFVFFSRGQWAAMGHINYVPASVLKRGSLKEFGQVFTHTSSLFPGAWWARVGFWECHVSHSPMDKAVRESAYVFECITGWPADPRMCFANDGPRETTRNKTAQQISHLDHSKINSGWVQDVHAIDCVKSVRIRLTVCCPD